MNLKKYLYEIYGAFLSLVFGMISAIKMNSEKKIWYSDLIKSEFNPPDYFFKIAWIILYLMIGIVIGNLYRNKKKNIQKIKLFFIQFVLNISWSTIFFQFHQIGLALINIFLILIFTLIFTFKLEKRNLILLMIPYILWLTFAAYLNYQIYINN